MSYRRYVTASLAASTIAAGTVALAHAGQAGQQQEPKPRIWVDPA